MKDSPVPNPNEDVKKLLILLLLKLGTTQSEIASALGVSQSSISRIIPGKVLPLRGTAQH